MSVETLQRAQTPEPAPQQTESIFKYYSVENEIEFLRTIDPSKVTSKDAKFYIEENVFRFLGEFAGKVPYTQISYIQEEGGPLTFAGIDLTDSYRKTAQLGDEREHDEMTGYEKINRSFVLGSNTATLISPPKTADYGFVFHFVRDPDNPEHIKEYILRYDEKRGEISNSQAILDRIDPTQSHTSDRGFLQNPIVGISTHSPREDLEYVMRAVGIDERSIVQSAHFESEMRKSLKPWVDQYTQEIFKGNVLRAKTILTAAFNKAEEIASVNRRELRPELDLVDRQPDRITFQSLGAFITQYGDRAATVTGGGSCPSVSKKKNGDLFGNKNLFDSLNNGLTPNKILGDDGESEHFVCPKCDYHATGPIGDECPGCHITKEEFAKDGGAVC